MKKFFQALLADYGMVLVLLLLCGYYSFATIAEQSPTGEIGGQQVAEEIQRQFGSSARVLIAVGAQPEDASFVSRLQKDLSASGIKVCDVAKGQPKDAGSALLKLSAAGEKIDVIATTQSAGKWAVFDDVSTHFPQVGNPVLITPPSHRWPNFLKRDNLLNIANQIAIIAIIAIGMTLVVITGGIDLSIGSLIALSSVITGCYIRDYAGGVGASTTGMVIACILGIVSCGLVGAFSGVMITKFGVQPFIVTLAMMLVGSGLAYRLADMQSIYQIPDAFVWLGRGEDLAGMPNAVVLMLALYAMAHVLMSRMKLGRYLYAVGGNREAARLSGVPVRSVILFAYVTCGLLAGLGGVIMASQLKSGSGTYGNMYELYVIAAVVVGGTSLSGGEGKMLGTLIGALIIAVIQNGMNLTNIDISAQKIVLGLVILGAVLLDKLRKRRTFTV